MEEQWRALMPFLFYHPANRGYLFEVPYLSISAQSWQVQRSQNAEACLDQEFPTVFSFPFQIFFASMWRTDSSPVWGLWEDGGGQTDLQVWLYSWLLYWIYITDTFFLSFFFPFLVCGWLFSGTFWFALRHIWDVSALLTSMLPLRSLSRALS